MATLFIGHAAQKSKLHNLQYNEGGNHMAEAEAKQVFDSHMYQYINNMLLRLKS